jgi:hypothetical protein
MLRDPCLLATLALATLLVACDPRGGADPEIDALLGFTPSNVALDAAMFDGVGDVVMDYDRTCVIGAVATGRLNCGTDADAYNVFEMQDRAGNDVVVVTMNSLTIATGTTVEVGEDVPLVLVALDRMEIAGDVTVQYGKAGGAPGHGSATDGDGAGGGLPSAASPQNGTGGTHCGRGGATGDGVAAPDPYGNLYIVPLTGGSAGGGRFAGAGGGALQLVAGRQLVVDGAISAPGQGQDNVDAGAGAGGSLLLESQSVVIRGTLAANGGGGASENKRDGEDGQPGSIAAVGGVADGYASGGAGSAGTVLDAEAGEAPTRATLGGGSGGGGAGRIRINVLDDQFEAPNGVFSPALDTFCAVTGAVLVGDPVTERDDTGGR